MWILFLRLLVFSDKVHYRGQKMATWDVSEKVVKCEGCGAKYLETKQQLPLREKGSYDCRECGTRINHWNGGVDFSYSKINE